MHNNIFRFCLGDGVVYTAESLVKLFAESKEKF